MVLRSSLSLLNSSRAPASGMMLAAVVTIPTVTRFAEHQADASEDYHKSYPRKYHSGAKELAQFTARLFHVELKLAKTKPHRIGNPPERLFAR